MRATASAGPSAAAPTPGPDTSGVAVDMALGWCNGHGVPESVCTRCNASLVPKFKEAGDWCAAHGVPESQCLICNPAAEAAWAAMNPARAQPPIAGESEPTAIPRGLPGPDTSAIKPTLDQGWCGGHDVPESVCTRCNESLIPGFKQAGDWCAGHELPESQCALCNPGLPQRWADWRHRQQAAAGDQSAHMRIEPAKGSLAGTNDALCPVENLRIRFIDPTIVRKAGIEMAHVQRRPLSATIDVPGEIEFDATRKTQITPRMPGLTREVMAQIGDVVSPGDLLATVDSPALGEAKSRYIERFQDLKLAEADLQRVRTIARGVSQMLELCTPETGAKEIREALANSPVGDAKAKLLRAHAALQLARSEAVRAEALLKKNLHSERDHQAAQSALAAAEADFVAIREEIAFDVERARITADRSHEIAKSMLDAARRRLHILGLSAVQIDSIGTEPEEMLARVQLRSPIAGRIIERNVAAGESVDTGTVLFVVADLSTMWLMADMLERDLPHVRVGLPVIFTVDGMPGVRFEGTVSWISSQVHSRTRTVGLRADLPNPEGLLRAGMFGRARIVLHDQDEVLTIPADAVQTDGCCQLVFVQESATVFRPRKVMLGTRVHDFVEVRRGLADNEVIAGTGSFLMKTEILKRHLGAGCCEVDPGR